MKSSKNKVLFVGIWWKKNVGQGKYKWCGIHGLEWMTDEAKKLMEQISGVKFWSTKYVG